MDIASLPWLNRPMRPQLAALCAFLVSFASVLQAQVRWNFSAANGNTSTRPAEITGGTITAANLASGTLSFDNDPASTGAYTGATGGNHALVIAKAGALSTADSTYLQFTLTPTVALKIASVALGSRSVATGATTLTLYSSMDGFTTALGAASVPANGAWTRATFSNLTLAPATNTAVTFRIYASEGTAAASWRVDDVLVTFAGPTIETQPTLTATPAPAVSNGSATIGVTASGVGTLTYQWRKDGTAIPSSLNATAITATLELSTLISTSAGNYDVQVSDALGGTTTSNAAALTVAKAFATVEVTSPSATYNGSVQSASATTVPAGLPVILTYTGTGGISYGPSPAPPAGAGSYSVTGTINHSEYQGTGNGTLTIAKANATLTLGSTSQTYNGSPRFATATTTPTGLPVTFTYNGSATAPTTAGSYPLVGTINHANYAGTASDTFVITPASGTLALDNLTTTYDGTARSPTATASPSGQTVILTYTGTGSTTYGPSTTAPTDAGTYAVTATFDAGSNYAATATGTFTIASAAQTISFAPLPDRLTASGPLGLAATSSSGLPVSFTLVSGSPDIATLAGNLITPTGAAGSVTIRATQSGSANYLAAPVVERSFRFVHDASAPVLLASPSDTTAHVGETISLSATVGGAPTPTMQWRKNGVDIPGATDTQLSFASAALSDTGSYQIVATNLAGSIASTPITLTVTKRPQTITFPETASAYPAASTVALRATASSGLSVTYTLISGSGTLTGNTLTGQSGEIVIRATQAGDGQYSAAEPVQRTYRFIAGAVSAFISVPPADQTVLAGTNVVLHASALGAPTPTFRWQKEGADIPGATSATLTISRVSLADAGRYTVIATNLGGSSQASAQLIVRAAPQIIAQPASRTATLGTATTLQVTATGFPAPTYQWRRNGVGIGGATGSTLTFPRINAGDAGLYDVVVTNALGAVTSDAATLTVQPNAFAGGYFGRFTTGETSAGNLAVYVRPDGTAALFGHLPGLQTAVITLALPLDDTGRFSVSATTLARTPTPESASALPPTSAAPRPVTLSGRIDLTTGTLTGTVAELGVGMEGTRSAIDGPAAAQAGIYQLAVVGSASGRGYVIVGADGRTMLFTADASALDSLSGSMVGTRLEATSVGGTPIILTFGANGVLSGTARINASTTVALSGIAEGAAGTERLINLSTRGITTPASPLIAGFVITGTTPKQVLVRAAGPALAGNPFNVAGALANPSLQILRGTASAGQNDNWGTPAANGTAVRAASTQTGAFPFANNSADAALVATLQPGAYTAVIGGGTGIVLAEVYEVLASSEAPGTRRLANVSTRALVSPTTQLIAGFVIGGSAPRRVLIRGVGPTLGSAPFNVAGVLANPQITVFRGGTAIRNNDDWFRDATAAALLRTAAANAGAFALGATSLDAALLVYLEPGAYTVQVTGPANAQGAAANGIALVEIYESPE